MNGPDCDDAGAPEGPAYAAITSFIRSNEAFYTSYLAAWKIATENGSGLSNSFATNQATCANGVTFVADTTTGVTAAAATTATGRGDRDSA